MILMTEKIIKLLLVATILIVFWKRLSIKKKKGKLALFVIIIILGIMAQFFCFMAPSLTETVSVKALGEKNPASGADEIFISGISIDGENIGIPKPIEGKWFWGGERYLWRNERDPRQPEGTTREIVFEIPVGWDRRIAFEYNEWSGKAVVSCLGTETEVDAYSTGAQTVQIELPKSESLKLITQSCLRILTFAIALIVLSGLLYTMRQIYDKEPQKVRNWVAQYQVNIGCGIIALSALLFMVKCSETELLWNDEIWQIDFAIQGTNVWNEMLALHSTYYGSWASDILELWYRIAPYGAKYLLLPSELATTAGIYLIGMTGKVLRNGRTAITAAGIAAVSSNLILQCGFEYRPYGFLFFGCALTLWLYCRIRSKGKLSWFDLASFGICMWLSAGCHIFGVFFCVPFFLTDVFLYYKRFLPLKAILSYILAGILFIPWIYNMFCYHVATIEATWMGTPDYSSTISLINYLTSYNQILLLLFWIGMCTVFMDFLVFRFTDQVKKICEVTIACIPCFTIGFVYLYGKYFNATATLWMERYFIVLFPCVVMLIALALDSILRIFQNKQIIANGICAAIILCVSTQTLPAVISVETAGFNNEHFQEAADWFYTQQNVIYNKSTLIIYAPDAPYRAWQEYCLTKQGLRDPIQVISQYNLTSEDLEGINIVYAYYEHIGMSEFSKNLLAQTGFSLTANDSYLKIATYTKTA